MTLIYSWVCNLVFLLCLGIHNKPKSSRPNLEPNVFSRWQMCRCQSELMIYTITTNSVSNWRSSYRIVFTSTPGSSKLTMNSTVEATLHWMLKVSKPSWSWERRKLRWQIQSLRNWKKSSRRSCPRKFKLRNKVCLERLSNTWSNSAKLVVLLKQLRYVSLNRFPAPLLRSSLSQMAISKFKAPLISSQVLST